MRQRKTIKRQACATSTTGSAIAETVAGLLILLPVFMLLLDVMSLVIAQSVNDDLAKQAARFAGQQQLVTTTNSSGAVVPDTTTMTNQAYTLANNYVSNTPYATAASGIITNASIVNNTVNFNITTGQVQVITQIQCNLPIAVPFGGPSFTIFQAQATAPIVGIQPSPGS